MVLEYLFLLFTPPLVMASTHSTPSTPLPIPNVVQMTLTAVGIVVVLTKPICGRLSHDGGSCRKGGGPWTWPLFRPCSLDLCEYANSARSLMGLILNIPPVVGGPCSKAWTLTHHCPIWVRPPRPSDNGLVRV